MGPDQKLDFHPLANLFPLMEGSDFDELVGSIRANGLRCRIVTYEGKILDGRNRYRACQVAGREPFLEPFIGDDPLKFVIDMNIPRRHLNESQRALIAAQLVTTRAGENQYTVARGVGDKAQTTLQQAAKLLNVSKSEVSLARKVLTDGSPEEIAAIKQGTTRVNAVGHDLRAAARQNKPPRAAKTPRPRGGSRAETQQLRANIWAHLRDAFTHLASLPLAAEVAHVAREKDHGGLIDRRLEKSINWLKEFADAWNARSPQQQGEPDVQD